MGRYGVTDIDKILDILGGRIAQGPQGALTTKAGLANSGYSTVTDEKNAVTGLGRYRRAQDTAIQQLLSQASDTMAQHADQAAAAGKTRMEDAYTANESVDGHLGDAEFARQAGSYAGQSAQLWNQQHPTPEPPPQGANAGTGAYGGQSQVFAGPPREATQVPERLDPTVVGAASQQADIAQRLPADRAGAEQRLTDAYTEMGRAGGQRQEAVARQGAQQQALNELLYGPQGTYDVNAAVEMGIDPLVAVGQFADTPSEQVAGYRQGRDLQSLNEHGMLYDEYSSGQKQQQAQEEKARQDALDQLINTSVGVSPAQAQFRSGLPEDQLSTLLSTPAFQQDAQTQDELVNRALTGDTQAASDLLGYFADTNEDPTTQRLLRARMNALGLSDTELANLVNG